MIKRNNLAKIIISGILGLLFWTITCINFDLYTVYTDRAIFKLGYFITALTSSAMISFLGTVKFKFNNVVSKIAGSVVYAASLFGAMSLSVLFWDGFNAPSYYYFVNVAFYFGFAALALVISGNMRFSAISAIVFSYIFNVASHIVYCFRGTPLTPTDIYAFQTAMNVASEYEFKLRYEMITATIFTVAHIMLAFKFPLKFKFKLRHYVLRGMGAAVLAAFFVFLGLNSFNEVDVSEYDQAFANTNFGFAFSYYKNATKMGLAKSDTYNAEKLDDMLLSYQQPEALAEFTPTPTTQPMKAVSDDESDEDEDTVMPTQSAVPTVLPSYKPVATAAPDKPYNAPIKTTLNKDGMKPNIIVIMNESFSDLSVINSFDTNQDYMPFFRSLENNAIKGELLVSPFGGYTCNTEYEFLTGMSVGMLNPHATPYLQMIFNKMPYSLNTHMRRLGYKATAVHPYYANGWNRNQVYNYLGFDEFISLENFKKYSEYPEKVRGYISDKGNYSSILNMLWSKDPEEREFVFDITIQNHGGYDYDDFENTVYLQNMQGDYPEAEQYLSLIKRSDDDFKYFINEIKNFEEPTIVVMFGDHMPNIEQEFYEELYGKPLSSISYAEAIQRYKVPFVIWANYDIEEKTDVKTSPAFLSNYIMEAAQLPKSRVQMYLDDLQTDVKQINPLGHYNAAGELKMNKNEPKLEEYYDLQYALLNGEKLHYDYNIASDTYEMLGNEVIAPRFVFGKEYNKVKYANP